MSDTRANLDVQSDKVLTEPTVQTRARLLDAGATQSLFLDWVEPAVADRTVTFEDPGADDVVCYLDKAQVFQNKQITTTPSAGDDVANKTYVDTAAAGGTPTATSGSGGATVGKLTMDSDKGLLLTAGVAEVKIDGASVTFNGSGELQSNSVLADATAGSGGATKGKATFDSDKGIDAIAGVVELKVDGSSMQFNGFGELQSISGAGGAATGTVSSQIAFTEDIVAITPPVNGTTGGGDISTLDFETAVIEGTRFSFSVPDDYFSGDIEISCVQQMSSSDAAGSIEIETTAKIVDISLGTIDSASYPATQTALSVPTNTDIERRTFLIITEGDFAKGDTIQVLYKRLGSDVSDVHPGGQQVLSFQFAYIAVVSGRVANRQVNLFENAPGETATTSNTISGGDITVEDYLTAVDTGLKFDFTVPDNWDEASTADIRISYVMSATDGGDVRLETRAKIARTISGTIDTIGTANFDFTPGAGGPTVPKATTPILSISTSALSKGDVVTVIVVRRGTAVEDTHPGDLQLMTALITFGVVAPGGVSTVTIKEEYLNQGTFGNASGFGIKTDTDLVDLTDFETYDNMSSTVASGSVDVSYQGRLGGLQSTITQIRFFIKGTGASPQYTLKIYAEGTGLVHTDGPNSAPGGSTEIVKTDVDLSAQPTGSKRFVVVITADIDSGEAVLVSRPFAKLE